MHSLVRSGDKASLCSTWKPGKCPWKEERNHCMDTSNCGNMIPYHRLKAPHFNHEFNCMFIMHTDTTLFNHCWMRSHNLNMWTIGTPSLEMQLHFLILFNVILNSAPSIYWGSPLTSAVERFLGRFGTLINLKIALYSTS